MKSVTTIRSVITVSMIMLMLSAGFIIYSYDRNDNNVKILNDDNDSDETYKNGSEKIVVVNPVTGETFDSVREFRFRNTMVNVDG